MPKQMIKEMLKVAKQAAQNAYAPYSNFPVGAAILGDDEKIYPGCNMENASYVSCMCAEGNAVGNAVAAGVKKIQAVLVYTPTKIHSYPCGNCRQILGEFAEPDAIFYTVCLEDDLEEVKLKTLLPHSFSGANLTTHNRSQKTGTNL